MSGEIRRLRQTARNPAELREKPPTFLCRELERCEALAIAEELERYIP
jgi:hypothetical protein